MNPTPTSRKQVPLPVALHLFLFISCIAPWTMIVGLKVMPFGGAHTHNGPLPIMLLWPVLMFTIMVSIAVHELGHLLAAILVGFDVEQVAIKPLCFVRVGRTFQLRFYLFGRDGQVGVSPRGTHWIRQKIALFAAGGPVANLLASLTCLVLASFADPASPPLFPRTPLSFWLDLAFLSNLVYFLINVAPFESGAMRSDGGQLLAHWQDANLAERTFLVSTLQTEMRYGARPSAWDEAQVERMLELRDGSAQDFQPNVFAYLHALDTQRSATAGRYLDLALGDRHKTDPMISDAILLEKAYFEALHRQNTGARCWLPLVQRDDIEKNTHWRAEAAVLFVEGRYLEASVKAEAALAEVQNSIDLGASIAEAEWLQKLLTECQKRVEPNMTHALVPTAAFEVL
jgi:peptidase M50-like protein